MKSRRCRPSSRLPAEVVAAFAQWIADGRSGPSRDGQKPAGQGAAAASPLGISSGSRPSSRRPTRPAGPNRPIDRFIAARRRAAGLAARATGRPADLDPPRHVRPDRTAAHAGGSRRFPRTIARPAAFARVVDRLLASPHYGERWGRHWMDVVRYADTAGDNADYPVPEAARYRDYIIDSFNRDKPSTSSSASNWPATSWPARASRTTTPSRSSPPGFWPCRGAMRRRRSSSGT